MKLEVDISNARDQKEVEELIIDRVMDHLADKIFQRSQENLISMDAVDTGFLLKSGNVERNFLEKIITYDAPYADIIEFGSEPGRRPPHRAIEAWAKRKLGLPDKEARSAAFAIGKSIEQKGTKPRPFVRKAIDEATA